MKIKRSLKLAPAAIIGAVIALGAQMATSAENISVSASHESTACTVPLQSLSALRTRISATSEAPAMCHDWSSVRSVLTKKSTQPINSR